MVLVDWRNLRPRRGWIVPCDQNFVLCFFRLGIKACAVLIPLLGVTWLLGLLSPLHKAFVYIFTILNSAQVSLWILVSTIYGISSISVSIRRIAIAKRCYFLWCKFLNLEDIVPYVYILLISVDSSVLHRASILCTILSPVARAHKR